MSENKVFTFLYEKIWKDPVISKVIAAGIILLITVIYGSGFFSKSLFSISWAFLFKALLWALISFALLFILVFLTIKIVVRKRTKVKPILLTPTAGSDYYESLPVSVEHSTSFFSQRLAKAFPGQRGLAWYDAKTAVQRLKILLQQPLAFRGGGYGTSTDPIWWFRAMSASHILEFEILSKTKILLGLDELEIKRIAVIIDNAYYKSYIYVEARGEKSVAGTSKENIDQQIAWRGHANEEYGLYGKVIISRQEYDDGAALIKGKIVESKGTAKLRARYLSDYNFIIAAKQSPYNSRKFESDSTLILKGILEGTYTPEDLFSKLETYQKNEQ